MFSQTSIVCSKLSWPTSMHSLQPVHCESHRPKLLPMPYINHTFNSGQSLQRTKHWELEEKKKQKLMDFNVHLHNVCEFCQYIVKRQQSVAQSSIKGAPEDWAESELVDATNLFLLGHCWLLCLCRPRKCPETPRRNLLRHVPAMWWPLAVLARLQVSGLLAGLAWAAERFALRVAFT